MNFLMISNGNFILFYRGKINAFYLKAYKWMAEILPTLGGYQKIMGIFSFDNASSFDKGNSAFQKSFVL